MDFVESGKGIVALHSASEMFAGSERYTTLIGAQSRAAGLRQRVHGRDRPVVSHPAVQGVQPFATWDETVTFTEAERHRPHGADGARRRHRPRRRGRGCATQGKGRVFYTAYGHDQRTWNNPGFRRSSSARSSGACPSRRVQAFQQLKMPPVTYVDGMNVPNYENRDPAPKYQLPFDADESMKFVQVPAEFSLEPLRHRARHRQADRLHVRRARPAVDRRDDRLPERAAGRRIPATTASRSSRTPTATARPTSSPSSPTTSTSRRAWRSPTAA